MSQDDSLILSEQVYPILDWAFKLLINKIKDG